MMLPQSGFLDKCLLPGLPRKKIQGTSKKPPTLDIAYGGRSCVLSPFPLSLLPGAFQLTWEPGDPACRGQSTCGTE